jgi:hypothetical protein
MPSRNVIHFVADESVDATILRLCGKMATSYILSKKVNVVSLTNKC